MATKSKRRLSNTTTTAPNLSAPPANCKLHSTAIIADKAQLTGAHGIEIGEGTFVHPYARVDAEFGRVVIGRGCIVSEKAVVGERVSRGVDGGEDEGVVVIGDGVGIEAGASVAARRVGEHCMIEVNASVDAGAVLGKWCRVGACCVVAEGEVLEDFTVVFGDGRRRVDAVAKGREDVREARARAREMEIEVLRTLVADGSMRWRGG